MRDFFQRPVRMVTVVILAAALIVGTALAFGTIARERSDRRETVCALTTDILLLSKLTFGQLNAPASASDDQALKDFIAERNRQRAAALAKATAKLKDVCP